MTLHSIIFDSSIIGVFNKNLDLYILLLLSNTSKRARQVYNVDQAKVIIWMLETKHENMVSFLNSEELISNHPGDDYFKSLTYQLISFKFGTLGNTKILKILNKIKQYDFNPIVTLFACCCPGSVLFLDYIAVSEYNKHEQENLQLDILTDVLCYYDVLELTQPHDCLLKSFTNSNYLMRYKDRPMMGEYKFDEIYNACVNQTKHARKMIYSLFIEPLYDLDY